MYKRHRFVYSNKTVYLLLFVIILSIISSSVYARVISEERVDVEMDDYQTLELQGKKDGVLEINVKVLEGDAVDVFLMNEANFFNYMEDRDYEYFEDGSALNINEKKWKFKAHEDGIYHIVLDNTDKGEAYPTSDIVVKVVVSDVTSTPFIGGIEIITAISIGAFLTIITSSKRRKKRS